MENIEINYKEKINGKNKTALYIIFVNKLFLIFNFSDFSIFPDIISSFW